MNKTKSCTKSFPQNFDVLATIISDVDSVPAFDVTSSLGQVYSTNSKTIAVLIIIALIWTLFTIVVILFFPTKNAQHLFLTIPGAILAATSTGIFSSTFSIPGVSLGPGAYLLWAWAICMMFLAPMTAIVSATVFLSPFLIALWIAFLFLVFLWTGLQCLWSGDKDSEDEDISGWWSTGKKIGS